MTVKYEDYRNLAFEWPCDGVLKITIDRPHRHNAADEVLHGELVRIWSDVDGDDRVRAVLITGRGRAFSAGGDFDMIERNMTRFDTRARNWKQSARLVYDMVNCGKPIVSAINGAAAGAGLTVALLADVSIAARSAKLVDGHTRLGVPPGDHAAIAWPLLCGLAKAKYYLMTCDAIDGETAERIGLVSLVADDDRLADTALEVASRLAQGPPTALRWTKYALNNWLRAAGPIFDASLALEFLAFTGPEPVEGLAAHREKRAPSFSPDSPV
ncbi:enoyl-CoA hydratase/isomerase family protein [Pseudonocardia acaciae]|uniref:enoyl-CoA hydratase/isomerase family protein n=1 Tax=Pseudonocardia acaciae TaxID=551276 RepID=UPI00048E031F|nr:enoyl-CoA hydratase/isomerase family protein [Pseudonocardia acaciae]